MVQKQDDWEELSSALAELNAAIENRKLSFEQSVANKDTKKAAFVLAHEVKAEMRITQLMQKYAAIADIWINRSKDGQHDQDAIRRAQTFAELESRCQNALAESETATLRRRYAQIET